MGCGNTRNVSNEYVKTSEKAVQKAKIKSKYAIVPKILRTGKVGTIYTASLRSNQEKKVAIKVLNNIKINNQQKEILTQVKKLKKLSHRHLVHYIESFENEYNIYLVMEYLNGGDLAHSIQKKARIHQYFSEREARDIIKKVLTCLKYCHSKGVVHGDLKPSDIMFDSGKEVKIIDFLHLGGNSYNSGSQFTSPEIKDGNEPNEKDDIYSLGCILYLMLTGRFYTGELIEKISENSASLLKSMLNKKERYSASECLRHPWILADLEEESVKDDFIDSDFESETTPLKKPQSQGRSYNQSQMLFRFGSERVQKNKGKELSIDTEKMGFETDDTSSVPQSARNQEAVEHEERMQKIMEEIFDDDPVPVSSAFGE